MNERLLKNDAAGLLYVQYRFVFFFFYIFFLFIVSLNGVACASPAQEEHFLVLGGTVGALLPSGSRRACRRDHHTAARRGVQGLNAHSVVRRRQRRRAGHERAVRGAPPDCVFDILLYFKYA
jgi:hypothetical protein